MAEREKVVKGLECLITNEVPCEGCPYNGSGYCLRNITKDAMDLLKEQEQTINKLEKKLRLLEYVDQDTLQSGMMQAT